jgi:hypothetical protein
MAGLRVTSSSAFPILGEDSFLEPIKGEPLLNEPANPVSQISHLDIRRRCQPQRK